MKKSFLLLASAALLFAGCAKVENEEVVPVPEKGKRTITLQKDEDWSNLDLTLLDGDPYHGRFELYKTENLYNFLLIDTQTGSVWQAQWSYNAANRGIVPIRDL